MTPVKTLDNKHGNLISKIQKTIAKSLNLQNAETSTNKLKFISSSDPKSGSKETGLKTLIKVSVPYETEEIVQIGGKYMVRKVRYEPIDFEEPDHHLLPGSNLVNANPSTFLASSYSQVNQENTRGRILPLHNQSTKNY